MSPLRDPRRARQAGVTLIELMIAMVIMSIAIAAALTMGYTMINGFRDSRRSVAVERAARGAITFLTKTVRSASAGVPTGDIVDLVGCDFTVPALQVINSSAGPDELKVVYAQGAVLTSLRDPFTEGSTELHVLPGNRPGTPPISEFRPGDMALIIDGSARGHLLPITAVVPLNDPQNTYNLVVNGGASASGLCPGVVPFTYPPTSIVVRAKRAHFFIDATGAAPYLMMDPDGSGTAVEPVAEGIEDLQIAVAVDDNPTDGTITEVGAAANDDEWRNNVGGDTVPAAVTLGNWRALRLTVTARALVEASGATDSIRPAAEDHGAPTAGDAFRRRSITTTVEIRNLTGSP